MRRARFIELPITNEVIPIFKMVLRARHFGQILCPNAHR